jgi:hypothetical protein
MLQDAANTLLNLDLRKVCFDRFVFLREASGMELTPSLNRVNVRGLGRRGL